jgi:Ser/Thr protein kinase RdoA (MazF antagonist)
MPTRLTAVIVHPQLDRLLARPDQAGWALPFAELAARHWHADHAPLAAALAAELGEPAAGSPTLLRRLAEVDEGSGGLRELAMLAELPPPREQVPDGWTWIDARTVSDITLPWAQAAAIAGLASLSADIPAVRPPWARERSGWHAALLGWVDEALAGAGLHRLGALEPVKVWSLSAVYRAATDGGTVYVKAAAPGQPLFVDEARVTAALAERFPAQLPRVLAARPGEGWLLLADEGQPVRERTDLSAAERHAVALAAARTHAQLQVASLPYINELLAAGCVDRRLAVLSDQVAQLLADPLVAEYLAADRLARLRDGQQHILAVLDRLAALHLPPALVHGDLHLGNTLLRAGAPIFIDWTDTCIAPPMVDLIAPLWADDPALSAAWRDEYLAVWSMVVPPAVLEEAWQLNGIVLPLHNAVSYQYILAHLEPLERDDLVSAFTEFLGLLSDALPA